MKQLMTLLLAATLVFAADPSKLLRKAKEAMGASPPQIDRAMPLLIEANQKWEAESSQSDEYAESLDLLAILLATNVRRGAVPAEKSVSPIYLSAWKGTVVPYTTHALEIRDSNSNTRPEDLALALELQADALDRTGEGKHYWDRAFVIRAQRVAAMSNTDPAASGPGQTYPVGQGVTTPVIIQKREPDYDNIARHLYYSGSILMGVVIDKDGVPRRLQLRKNLGYGLDEKAAEAINTWRFQPATKDGVPVACTAQISVNFRLL